MMLRGLILEDISSTASCPQEQHKTAANLSTFAVHKHDAQLPPFK